MLVVPVRVSEIAEGGLWCRLGSEPPEDAPRRWVPNECILRRGSAEGTDLAVLVLDEASLPDSIREDLGLK